MKNYNYILITPAKNEEKDLPSVIESVINQTILPKLWLIIDDGSVDKTSEIIENYKRNYNFIKSIKLQEHPRDIYYHYSYICKIGFDYVIQYCTINNIHFEYIGLLDADTILERDYFEKLFKHFIKNPKLGIASGGIYYKKNDKLIFENSYEDFPRGTGRIWTKECFIKTGGYQLDPAMHTISNAKAQIFRYETKQFKDIIAIQTRLTSSMEGFWRSNLTAGMLSYYLYKRPFIVILNVIYKTIKFPFYCGFAFLLGYLLANIKKKPRIQDIEIINYFKNQKISNTFKLN